MKDRDTRAEISRYLSQCSLLSNYRRREITDISWDSVVPKPCPKTTCGFGGRHEVRGWSYSKSDPKVVRTINATIPSLILILSITYAYAAPCQSLIHQRKAQKLVKNQPEGMILIVSEIYNLKVTGNSPNQAVALKQFKLVLEADLQPLASGKHELT